MAFSFNIGKIPSVRVDWANVISSGAAVVAAIAAAASWRAAVNSNKTSSSLAEIERERRHAELTPQFEVRCEKYNDNIFYLYLWLRGPADLERIDSLTLTIRDNKRMGQDTSTQATNSSGEPTAEDIDKQIWAPYRFDPQTSGSSVDGRTSSYSDLKRGDECRFQLTRTIAPRWNTTAGTDWCAGLGISGQLKISILCKNFESATWTVSWQLERPQVEVDNSSNN